MYCLLLDEFELSKDRRTQGGHVQVVQSQISHSNYRQPTTLQAPMYPSISSQAIQHTSSTHQHSNQSAHRRDKHGPHSTILLRLGVSHTRRQTRQKHSQNNDFLPLRLRTTILRPLIVQNCWVDASVLLRTLRNRRAPPPRRPQTQKKK